jgi:O-acetylserine/cysteine efflux transporter
MKPIHTLLVILVVTVWGINFVTMKLALQELPPFFLCFARFALVSIPAIFFIKRPTGPLKWLITYSLVMFVLHFALMATGMRAGVSAGLASLLLQTQVFFSILFASLLIKEKFSLWQLFGSLLSFSGIAIVGLNAGGEFSLTGLLLVLLSASIWGLGTVLVKKMGKIEARSLLVWSCSIAWPPLLLLSLIFEQLPALHTLSYTTHGSVLFIAIFSTVFGFGTWNWLLQFYPVATVAPFTLLVPVFGMLSSALFLNETLESWKLFSGILVISGLCFNILGSRALAKKALNEF